MVSAYNYTCRKEYLRYLTLKFFSQFLINSVVRYRAKKYIHKDLNLKNPKTFTEKLNYLIRYDRNPIKTVLADKIEAKKYVKSLLPEVSSAQIFDIADSFENLNLAKCPDTFILKTNHAWRTNILIPDKNKLTVKDISDISKYYKRVLKINYAFWFSYEFQYENIKPRIFAEQLLTDKINDIKNEPFSISKAIDGFNIIPDIEFSVYCINGKAEFVTVEYLFPDNYGGYYGKKTYNPDMTEAAFTVFPLEADKLPECIFNNFSKVVKYAEKLASNINFVRVDFSETSNELYFMEMTFSPFSGLIDIKPYSQDVLLGEKLSIQKADLEKLVQV